MGRTAKYAIYIHVLILEFVVLFSLVAGADHCQLFGVERCSLLGGSKCMSSMVKSIGGK